MSGALWGQRERWGPVPDTADSTWLEWCDMSGRFYDETQQRGVGRLVNDAGYKVMRRIDLDGRTLLEIGPGSIRHAKYWVGTPQRVHLVDVDQHMAERGASALRRIGVDHTVHVVDAGQRLPLDDSSVDVVVAFYSLEHIYPLVPQLREFARVLTPGGVLIGAIPTEGGLAWGLGRLLTSRRWLRRNTSIDPDKLICWEHPNFADQVLRDLGDEFEPEHTQVWPIRPIRMIDVNLIISFVHRRRAQ
jgi:ubiquinone/menaquinone biosynthesis C-methylase UbiE